MMMFEPIQIGQLSLKNRIVFPPMTTGYEEKGGAVTPRAIEFYRTLARGGAGLITIGDVCAIPTFSIVPALYDDCLIEGHQKLVEAVHGEGAAISAQIFFPELDYGIILRAMREKGQAEAMALYRRLYHDWMNEIDEATIQSVQQKIVETAVRAAKAGYDMLQIHGDRLVGAFCSPILNKRTDGYGGSLEGRARFALELVAKIRAALPQMPLDYKLAIIRTNPPIGKGGPTLDEAIRMVPWLEEKGIDSFHVCVANHGSVADTIPAGGSIGYACFVDLAQAIKAVAKVPVSCVGRIIDPDLAESILQQGQADMVSLGRQLVADPDWPAKVASGRCNEIRYCVMCNKGCTDKLTRQRPIACAINAANGRETTSVTAEWPEQRKRVLIVGAGPAGLEAARVSALRGHRVTIVERSNALGGQLNLAVVPPHKDELNRLLDFYRREIARLGIEVRYEVTATPELIASLRYDELILATGAVAFAPSVTGRGKLPEIQAWEILAGEATAERRVLVVGGGSVGVEVAEYLAVRGGEVAIVEMGEVLAKDESVTVLPHIHRTLRENGVTVHLQSTVMEISSAGVLVEKRDGTRQLLPADLVVWAVGAKPSKQLAQALGAAGIRYHLIGDCRLDQVRLIEDAVRDGFDLALSL